MFERRRQANQSNNGTVRELGDQRINRSRQRARERADAERISELKWQWRCACERSDLADFVYTPTGVTRPTPQIASIELGPPVILTVRVRPGQSAANFIAAAPSIAPAMNVGAVEVVQIRTPWLLRIVLIKEPLTGVASGL